MNPESSSMPSSIEAGAEHHPLPMIQEGDVLDHLKTVESLRTRNLSEYPPEKLEALKHELLVLPEVVEYQKRETTSDSIQTIIDQSRILAGESQSEKAVAAAEKIGDLRYQVLQSAERYVASIRRGEISPAQRFRLDERELREEVSARDLDRRRIHEALLSNVHVLSRYLYQAFPRTLGNGPVKDWEQFVDQRWFTKPQMNDRKFIGQWAIETVAYEKIQSLIQAIDEAGGQKETAEAG